MVATVFQYCNAVLRSKSSLRIVPCKITLNHSNNDYLLQLKSSGMSLTSAFPFRSSGFPQVAAFSVFGVFFRRLVSHRISHVQFRGLESSRLWNQQNYSWYSCAEDYKMRCYIFYIMDEIQIHFRILYFECFLSHYIHLIRWFSI